jgi:subtilase family serine protease
VKISLKLAECTTANGCFKKVNQSGEATPLPSAESGWAVEISLDVETVHGVCPKCKILLVEAKSPTYADLGTAVNEAVKLGATEVSNSYGGPEGAGGEEAAYKHPGVVIAASAGDQGYSRGEALSACTFEYGTSTSYGSSVPCSALPGPGSSPVAVSASIVAGLVANTEYHFRIQATNTSGTSKGADVTFTTS